MAFYQELLTLEMLQKDKQKYKYSCNICSFNSNVLRDLQRHLKTDKHQKMVKYTFYTFYTFSELDKKPNLRPHQTSNLDLSGTKFYTCICGKTYKHAGSLSNHKKTCSLAKMAKEVQDIRYSEKLRTIEEMKTNCVISHNFEHDKPMKNIYGKNTMVKETTESFLDSVETKTESTVKPSELEDKTNATTAAMMSLLQVQTEELKKIVDATEKIKTDLVEVKSNTPSITNIQNNTINFNVMNFLNTECGQAMSLKDFLDSIELSLEDIYYTRDHGYVKGMSKAFIERIETIGYNRRPIHCTDKKRLKFFIKGSDGSWMRDNDNSNLNEAVSIIKYKHIQKLEEWKAIHPDWSVNPSESDEFLLMCKNFMEDAREDGGKKKQALLRAIGAATGLREPMSNMSSGCSSSTDGEINQFESSVLVSDDGINVSEMVD